MHVDHVLLFVNNNISSETICPLNIRHCEYRALLALSFHIWLDCINRTQQTPRLIRIRYHTRWTSFTVRFLTYVYETIFTW
jgi:hypothetical protein